MKKLLILILLLSLTGCNQNLGADKKIKSQKDKYEESIIVKSKYKLEKSAFVKEAKTDDDLRVEIGDKTKDAFVPEMTIGKWNEVSMKIKANQNNLAKEKRKKLIDSRMLGAVAPELVLNEEKIEYTEDGLDYVFYDIEPNDEHPEGAYEFEIILNEIPTTNIIEVEIETDGLDFFYQPELTQEEIDEGTMRPENVIGSYAVYHSTKQDHIIGQTNYKTGKAFHIYRPKIIGSDMDWIWADLNIKKHVLTIEIDSDWLSMAKYPVIVDPTFGYDTIGGTTRNQANTSMQRGGDAFDPGEEGTVTEMSIYSKKDAANVDAQIALYQSSDESLVTNGNTNTFTIDNSSAQWFSGTFSIDPSVTSQGYHLAFWIDYNNPNFVVMYYDTAISDAGYKSGQSAFTWPDPANWTTWTNHKNKYSIYATYTAAAGDTCTYGGSGDWNVLYSDNCYVTSETYVLGACNIIFDGAGSFNLQATLICDDLNVGSGASIFAENSSAQIELY